MKCISTSRQQDAVYVYFDYFNKASIFLSATSDGISIALFATAIGAPVEIASASFRFVFSKTTGITKSYKKQHKVRRKNMTRLLC